METPENPVFPPDPKPRRGYLSGRLGCLFGFGGGCLVALLLIVLVLSVGGGLLVGGVHALMGEVDPAQPYRVVAGDPDEDEARGVLRVEISGVITGSEGGWGATAGNDAAALRAIEHAIDDEDIHAILLVIDSPGGVVGPSDALYHALERFKLARPGRVVVVQAEDLLASGAYYVAMQADWISVTPTTVVGSIGVIMPGLNAAGLAQKLGLADSSVASGPSKDLGNPLKPVNPAHTAIQQAVVDALYDRFVGIVAGGRHLPESDVRALADGRILSARDALELRLVDAIGYEDGLDAKLAELLNCPEKDLVRYAPPESRGGLGALLGGFSSEVGRGAAEALLQQSPATPQYLLR